MILSECTAISKPYIQPQSVHLWSDLYQCSIFALGCDRDGIVTPYCRINFRKCRRFQLN